MLCMLLAQQNIFSQSENVFSIGPRVGVNIANVSNVDDSKSTIGLVAGVTSTYSISQTSGISLDILYSQEGYETDDGDELSADYIQVPIYFNVFFGELGEAFRPKIYVGVAPGFLMKGEANGTDISDSMNSIVFSVTGGLGFNYRIADRVWLNVDLRSFLGLTDLRDEDNQDDETVAARNVQITAGVAFGLSRLD